MSYPSKQMRQDTAPHAMSVSLKQHAELPQILRQSNYLGPADMRTANVNFRVKPHTESAAAPVAVERVPHSSPLYPTQSASSAQPLPDHEHDWKQHAIVASVAGLHTKLEQLDSEIRQGASQDAGASVMRQMQDHASLLRENAKTLAATQSKHKEVTALTHKIFSQINDSVQVQSTSLSACNDNVAQLKTKHSQAVVLTHDICSELQKTALEHAEHGRSLQTSLQKQQDAISLLQKKDVVAQALLGKMLAMLDQHDSVVANGKPLSQDHLSLLECMCQAFEKTKTQMQSFEQTQQEMQRVLADFRAAKLPPAGAHESEGLQTKLDRYQRLYNDIDSQCTQALQQHGAKMEEMQRSLHEHRTKMKELERKVLASQSEQGKIAALEDKVQELALQQLNHSQSASIARVTERDVKLLKHEMQQLHGLRKDFDRKHDALQADVRKAQGDSHAAKEHATNSVSSMQADLRRMQLDSKARNDHSLKLHTDLHEVKSTVSALAHAQQAGAADKSSAEMHARMLEMQRNLTLQNIRLDKNATTLHDIQCKLAA